MAKLGDLGRIITGNTPKTSEVLNYSSNDICFVKPSDILDGELTKLTKTEFYISEYARPKARILPPKSVLVTCIGIIGKVAINDVECAFNQQINAIIPDFRKCLTEYLGYAIQNKQKEMQDIANAPVVPILNKTQFSEIEVSLPSIEEQVEIVEKINATDKLTSLRKEQLAKMDELVKSRFIEMFGNLVIGDKICTNKHKIGEIASVTKLAGFEFTKYIQYKEQGEIIMLRGLNCKKGHLVLDDIKWIDKETSDLLPRSKLYYGDILMTYAGTIGDVAMVDADDKYHLAPNVAKITLTDKMAYNPVFLIHLFMYTTDYIMTFASVVAQASINMEKIRNFEYYFPSVEQQNAFATFVEQTDKSKFEIQKSLEKLETLKKSLMQKYFG